MSAGRREDAKDDDKLFTSEDLFGEMLDEKRPAEKRPAAGKARPATPPPRERRSGPIKVQVSEPSTPGATKVAPTKEAPAKASPSKSPLGGSAGELPEDVAALLDAFSAPGEAAATKPAAKAPEIIDDLAGAAELFGAEEVVPEVTRPAPAGPPSSRAAAPAPPEPEPPAATTTDAEALQDLRSLRVPATPGGPAATAAPPVEAAPPEAKSRLTTKFRAAEAHEPAPEHDVLDLAAIADEALGQAPPPASAGEAGAPSAAAEPGAGAPPIEEPAPPAPEPGRSGGEGTYGPYRLLQRIALGGMAEVFKAKRSGVEGFEKVVAVKRILPHLSDNKEFVDMFVDEAKMVAGLTHPNIVQIFDLGKIEKSYYIAMEYVQGHDVRSILRRAREWGGLMPLDLSALVVSRVCAALEYAHRKKDEAGKPMMIVHRDISPQNILISFDGEVKLTDFGIAKAASKATVTEAGALRGKLLYMSPEQAWGKPMDRRSDLFSLGIVFYEMLTDQKPFLGSSEVSILETVRECKVAPPRSLNRDIPPSLERVVMKALEREPERRYQDASEMSRDLEAVMQESPPAPTTAALARLMEQLYEPGERASEAAEAPEASPAEAGGEAAAPPPAETSGPSASMSIQKLLRRFGIK